VIVPLQPSIFDILATRHFLDRLFEEKEIRKHEAFVAIVAMRVDARTRAAASWSASSKAPACRWWPTCATRRITCRPRPMA
jgi:cellulose biosynthesis protein BcsQ